MADQGEPNAKEASICKAHGGQRGHPRVHRGHRDLRRRGLASPREHQLLEKWFRDIKVYDIFEGTGQIQRIVISKRLFADLKSF